MKTFQREKSYQMMQKDYIWIGKGELGKRGTGLCMSRKSYLFCRKIYCKQFFCLID